MTAPPIGGVDRYVDPGATRTYWVETIAVTSAPTRLELDAGIDLTSEIAEIDGFRAASSLHTRQPINSQWELQRVGPLSVGSAGLFMYADRAGADIRQTLTRMATGHIVFLHGGDVTGHAMDVYPVTVALAAKPIDYGAAPAIVAVTFAVSGEPQLNLEVP